MGAYLRSLNPQLPRDVWFLQLGGVFNSFGNGLVFPFLVIYLHDVRGFSVALAGLVIGISSVAQLAAGLASGVIVERVGARATLGAALLLQAVGFGLFPLIRHPWHAVVLVTVEGLGSAGFWPAQSTLLARLTPPARRHAAYAQQRVTMNLGIGLGGLTGGLIARASEPRTFTVLFVLDAITFFAYLSALGLVRDPGVEPSEQGASSYREVLRDRPYLGLWGLNFLFVVFGYSMFGLLAQFAKDQSHVTERAIGAVFFVNTLVIVIAQLPVSKWLEGKRRMRALALMPALWAVAWLVVEGAGIWFDALAAAALIGVAAVLLGIGETLHGPAHQALVADLAPDRLRGRYFALSSMSWGLGGAVGPAAGGYVLDVSPLALWPLLAGIGAVTAVAALALERAIPEELRRIPRGEVPERGLPGTMANMPVTIDDPLSTDAEPPPHPAQKASRRRRRRRPTAR